MFVYNFFSLNNISNGIVKYARKIISMSIQQTKVYNHKKAAALNKIDNTLAPAKIFAKSFGLQPFKIIEIEDEDLQLKLLPEISETKINSNNTRLIIFAIKPLITHSHINDFFTDIKISKKATGHSLSNYRRNIEDIIKNKGDGWTSKQAYNALEILSSSARQTAAEITIYNILNPALFDKELHLEEQGLTAHIAVKIHIRTSKKGWSLLPENKN
jgi:nitroreductase/dihydropteridine reductase